MAQEKTQIDVYVEAGKSKTFVAALDWPGWCRSGRNEVSALQSLFEYGPRYARVLQRTRLGFQAPSETSALVVVEQLKGNSTTDFGAPNLTLPRDNEPVEPEELERWQKVLSACWRAFDRAVQEASGETLSKGPRGGGRELGKIVQHVHDIDAAYLKSLGGKLEQSDEGAEQEVEALRRAILNTLRAAGRGEVPARGPRGGVRWTPRYFVRRTAWHVLDHAWEIEDRAG
jgi:hypothetical protein